MKGITATDLVLTVSQMLRQHGVVGKFVEFYGDGLDKLPLQLAVLQPQPAKNTRGTVCRGAPPVIGATPSAGAYSAGPLSK